MFLFGPPNIEKLKARRDVPGLIKALGYRKDLGDISRQAVEALVEIGTSAVEPLIASLEDTDAYVRSWSATTLGWIGDRRAVEPLITRLKKDENVNVRKAAAIALGKIGGKQAVKALIDALNSVDWDVRQAAAKALGETGDQSAIVPLINALKEPIALQLPYTSSPELKQFVTAVESARKEAKQTIIEALSRLGDQHTAELLIPLLDDQDGSVRQAAAEALVKIGAPAIQPLSRTLQGTNNTISKAAARILRQLGWKPQNDHASVISYHIARGKWDELAAMGTAAVEPLIAALQNTKSAVRMGAAGALGQIGDRRAVEPLIALLEDERSKVREKAAWALGQLKDPRAFPALSLHLGDKNPNVQKAVAEALGQIGNAGAVESLLGLIRDKVKRQGLWGMKTEDKDACTAAVEALVRIGPPAVDSLIAALKDEYWGMRRTAAEALGAIGDVRAVESLIATLRDESQDVRRTAAEALGAIGDARAVEPLIAALRDESQDVRWTAAEALVKIGAPAMEPLIAALKDESLFVRQAAAEALGKIGDARAVESLIAALKDESSSVRRAAAEALGAIGDARAVEPLIAALKDKDEDVRRTAAEALEKLGWQPAQDETAAWYWIAKQKWEQCIALGAPAVEPLIAALEDESSSVRQAAAKALGAIGDARAVEPLIAALKDWHVREAAAGALGAIGDARAVEPLIAVLKDESWVMRRTVARSLGAIGDARAVAPLIAALKDKDEDVRRTAAEALEKLGWQPDQGEDAVWYWIIKGKWEKSAALGLPAVAPLIAALKDESWRVRRAAAEALVLLYQNSRNKWPELMRTAILEQRAYITRPHEDQYYHSDHTGCGGHSEAAHMDRGIGVDFPL